MLFFVNLTVSILHTARDLKRFGVDGTDPSLTERVAFGDWPSKLRLRYERGAMFSGAAVSEKRMA
jgi:hypothetical protein